MRKKIIPAFLLIIAVISSSCEKIEESSPTTLNTSNTANISGRLFANLIIDKTYVEDNFGNFGNNLLTDTLEYAPEGTEIHFRVSKSEYNPTAPTDQMLKFTSTVGTNGNYSINLPATNEGVNVEISFDDFLANKRTWELVSTSYDSLFNPVADFYSSSTSSKKYIKSPETNTFHTGEDKFLNFTYN